MIGFNVIGRCGVLLLSLSLLGCQGNLKNRAEVYSYIQNKDNGVLDVKENNGVTVTMSYIPKKLIFNSAEKAQAAEYLYFRLLYQIDGKDMLSSVPQNSYSVLLNRLSFKLGDYLSLSRGGKREEIADYQFSPTFGTTNASEVIVSIEAGKLTEESEIVFKLNDIGLGIPDYEFKFDKRSLDRLEDLTQELETQD
ncbi:hypothetical protein [Sphingobacterium thalpophilum]|uniref:hypothetical protein n=1 Tax=Sphingobacterium thalpophilum TaxID=259 RepID=UPI002D769513|nr:hypothetical protein [Sphingobacterium thalpophilum]